MDTDPNVGRAKAIRMDRLGLRGKKVCYCIGNLNFKIYIGFETLDYMFGLVILCKPVCLIGLANLCLLLQAKAEYTSDLIQKSINIHLKNCVNRTDL